MKLANQYVVPGKSGRDRLANTKTEQRRQPTDQELPQCATPEKVEDGSIERRNDSRQYEQRRHWPIPPVAQQKR
ncbi:MAG: hypothetical protein H5T63_09260 [Chloroflexi bacterium]|nr:hypothetical protein [Chloroflexota bacterium]